MRRVAVARRRANIGDLGAEVAAGAADQLERAGLIKHWQAFHGSVRARRERSTRSMLPTAPAPATLHVAVAGGCR